MCALSIGHEDLLVDIDAIDIDRLMAAINDELIAGAIRFPFSNGRQLYDSYAQLFDMEKDVLTVEETWRLVETLPAGVYQYGAFVLGPYGLLKSDTTRSISFTRSVPAYHCSDPVCRAVHWTRLTTSHQAAINLCRDKLHRILDEEHGEAPDWWEFSRDISGFTDSYFGDQRVGVLVGLLGDCLSDSELVKLVAHLFDSTKGQLRRAVSGFIDVKSASDLSSSMSRAELLQVALLASEKDIALGLDRLVFAGEIEVPLGEVRRPVTSSRMRSGAFRLQPELGHRGVRFVSDDPGFASLREHRLLKKLYLADHEDEQELDWQLRGYEAEDLEERLEDFFRSTDPRTALTRLVLARKTNMITACEEVGLEDGGSLKDSDLIETLLWKLGFDIHLEHDPHRYFWDLHQRISALTQSSRISGIGESETFRGVASTYFAELEGLLLDGLAFATWVLLEDHTRAASPFSYDDELDRKVGLRRLQMAHEESGNEYETFDFTSDRTELRTLIRGFSVLAEELKRIESAPSKKYQRSEEDYPAYVGKTNLKTFLFKSTVPFLNLTESSRARLIEGLSQLSEVVLAADVASVRNDYSHYRRTAPEIERMTGALEAVGVAVRKMESLGIVRLLSWPRQVSTDAWGRSRHEFAGPRSAEHMFARPSSFDWMGLPSLHEPQYIIRAATFAEPNEVLRFTRRFESEFSRMWNDYPARRLTPMPMSSAPEVLRHSDDIGVTGPSV
jgi:hypothetical protein